MADFYIYYQVRDGDTAQLQTALGAMQAGLQRQHGVTCQLKRRPHSQDGLQTWMEVYGAAPPAFAAALDLAVAQAGLAAWIVGARHTEEFTDVVPCV